MGELLSSITNSGIFKMATLVAGIIFFVIAAMILYWIFRDSSERDSKPGIWLGVGAVFGIGGGFAGTLITKSGVLVPGIFSLLGVVVLYAVYKIVRPTDYSDDSREQELNMMLLEAEAANKVCPHCQAGVEMDYLICPECKRQLRVPCTYCSRPIKRTWQNCPYCTARQTVE